MLGVWMLRAALAALRAWLNQPVAQCLPLLDEAIAYGLLDRVAKPASSDSCTAATVRVELREGCLYVKVTNDGRGGADADGPGMQGLADRIAALGGRFDLRSPPGEGTTMTARLPHI